MVCPNASLGAGAGRTRNPVENLRVPYGTPDPILALDRDQASKSPSKGGGRHRGNSSSEPPVETYGSLGSQ
jgi:hypothetical protein